MRQACARARAVIASRRTGRRCRSIQLPMRFIAARFSDRPFTPSSAEHNLRCVIHCGLSVYPASTVMQPDLQFHIEKCAGNSKDTELSIT